MLTNEELTDELLRAKVQVASSLGGESFGMVLTRGLACAVPVVASDIPGYRAVLEGEVGRARSRPATTRRSRTRWSSCSATRTRGSGAASRPARSSQERYAWERIAARLLEIYEEAAA